MRLNDIKCTCREHILPVSFFAGINTIFVIKSAERSMYVKALLHRALAAFNTWGMVFAGMRPAFSVASTGIDKS